jgi:dTDP-4-dehydrorhamnose reductase
LKILIIGASGLVGWNLRKFAISRGHEVIGTYNSYALPGLLQVQLNDTGAVEELCAVSRPDTVVCCAAWSWVDGCERDPARAFRENRDHPAALARIAQQNAAQMVYISSSYVFNGEDGPYAEEAEPSPLSVYGKSKLEGENNVREACGDRALILRTMGVYGQEPQQKNFVYQVRHHLAEGRSMKVPNDQFGNASFAPDIASAVLLLLRDRAIGLWNIAGPNPNLGRADFALKIALEYGLDKSLLQFVPTVDLQQSAPRPRHGGLLIDKMISHYQEWRPTDWQRIE